MTFVIGRLVSGPKMLEITDQRDASPDELLSVAFHWFSILVSGLGIVQKDTVGAPTPCFDIDELHRRNGERLISQRKE